MHDNVSMRKNVQSFTIYTPNTVLLTMQGQSLRIELTIVLSDLSIVSSL